MFAKVAILERDLMNEGAKEADWLRLDGGATPAEEERCDNVVSIHGRSAEHASMTLICPTQFSGNPEQLSAIGKPAPVALVMQKPSTRPVRFGFDVMFGQVHLQKGEGLQALGRPPPTAH
jgi:hypothetical protein